MSKVSDDQSTPHALYDAIDAKHQFTLDAAANIDNHKCATWYGPDSPSGDTNALAFAWPPNERIWLNPPYSRGNQLAFVARAIDCAERGGYVIALMPADTSTGLFHDLIYGHFPIEFLKGRVAFNGMKAGAKFGSYLAYFTHRKHPLVAFRTRPIL